MANDLVLECGDGWKDIIVQTHEKLRWLDPDYTIGQIKEKFGGLRYYYYPSEDATEMQRKIMMDVVRRAEVLAENTCEKCGANNDYDNHVELRQIGYWYMTRCDHCFDDEVLKTVKRIANEGT